MINRKRDGQLYITGIYFDTVDNACFGMALDRYGDFVNDMYMNSAAGEDS